MVERNIRLILEYDGSRYLGWQRQKEEPTIQAVLEEAIRCMTGRHSALISSGRTDAGVHALHQVCNFRTCSQIPLAGLRKGLNALIPNDIYIKCADYVPADFHARYNAKSKTYEYTVLNRPDPDVFLRTYAWHVSRKLDVEGMKACTATLQGRHDFSSFRSSGSGNINPVREMMRSELHSADDGSLRFIFEANGFLRHMVRNIVGTVIEVGSGKFTEEEFAEILRAKDRRTAGIKAPSRGLRLIMVKY
ncbi:MAG: tRNA pseudouridine(38-40) synthase TruA [Deltaproteobacteria bacterium]|nr:tRNA pseudouridine(38-40) synthase TruA [Deltaproteobacteria bacterium]